MNIWLTTDWHLFRKPEGFSEYIKTKNYNKLMDKIHHLVSSDDILIVLGDLSHRENEQVDLKQFNDDIRNLPGYHILIKGNHDVLPDNQYYALGFDRVCTCGTYDNLIFTHKPVPVGDDEINIHGHIHNDKFVSIDTRHISIPPVEGSEDPPVMTLDDVLRLSCIRKDDFIVACMEMNPDKEQCHKISTSKDHLINVCDFHEIFDADLADLMHPIDEGVIFHSNDIKLNLDKWASGENNILYITGLSGSGKSTLAYEYEKKPGVKVFEMDGVEMMYDSSENRVIERAMQNVPEYKEKWDQYFNKKDYMWLRKEYPIIWKMWKEVIRVMKSDSKQLYVVEGIEIFDAFKPEDFYGKPMIIKGTSALISTLRAERRDGATIKDMKYVIDSFFARVKHGKYLNDFRKAVVAQNESTFRPACMPNLGHAYIHDAYLKMLNIPMINETSKLPPIRVSCSPRSNIIDTNRLSEQLTKIRDNLESPTREVSIRIETRDEYFSKPFVPKTSRGYYNPDYDKHSHILHIDDQEWKKWEIAMRMEDPSYDFASDYERCTMHECVHKIIDDMNPKVSMQFQEGICVYVCGQLDAFENIFKHVKKDSRESARSTYLSNAYQVKDIVENYGYDRLSAIIRGEISLTESGTLSLPEKRVLAKERNIPIFICLFHFSSALSTVIAAVTKDEYTHSAISFDTSLTDMYSFGKFYPNNPIIGKFVHESLFGPTYNQVTKHAVYVVFVTQEEKDIIKAKLEWFIANKGKMRYNYEGLIKSLFHVAEEDGVTKYAYLCSEFVASILKSTGRNFIDTPSNLVKPNDFKKYPWCYYLGSGLKRAYDRTAVDRRLSEIIEARNRGDEMYLETASEIVDESIQYFNDPIWKSHPIKIMRNRPKWIESSDVELCIDKANDYIEAYRKNSVENKIPIPKQLFKINQKPTKILDTLVINKLMPGGAIIKDAIDLSTANFYLEITDTFRLLFITHGISINPTKSSVDVYLLDGYPGSFFKKLHSWKVDVSVFKRVKTNVLGESAENPLNDILQLNDKLNKFKYSFGDGGEDGYQTVRPNQFEKNGYGACWDYVAYEVQQLNKNRGIKTTAWYVVFDCENGDRPNHVFVTIKCKEKTLYFESSDKQHCGVYIAASENEAIQYVISNMNVTNATGYRVYRYDPLNSHLFGCSIDEFMGLVENKIGSKISVPKSKKNVSLEKIESINESTTSPSLYIVKQIVKRVQEYTDRFISNLYETGFKSTIDSDHVQNGSKSLSDFKRITLTEPIRKNYVNRYPGLRHFNATDEQNKAFIWIDQKDDIAAMLYVATFDNDSDHRTWIEALEVTPEYKGYGLSKQLLDYATTVLHADALGVARDNKLAQSIYLKYGFKFGDDVGKQDAAGKVNRLMYLGEAFAQIDRSPKLYHGSNKKLMILNPTVSTHGESYVYATADPNFAVCYSGKQWNDFEINQCYWNGKLVLTEMQPGMFREKFETRGYLYELSQEDFVQLNRHEFVCKHPVTPISVEDFSVREEISGREIKMYGFPNLPPYIGDRAEYFKECAKTLYAMTGDTKVFEGARQAARNCGIDISF